MDRPAHTPVRSLFVAAYLAQDLAALARRGRQLADQLLDRLVRRSDVELMSELGAPLGLELTCDFLGVPCPDVASFSGMADAVVQSFDAGWGMHACIGGMLAKLVLGAALSQRDRLRVRPRDDVQRPPQHAAHPRATRARRRAPGCRPPWHRAAHRA